MLSSLPALAADIIRYRDLLFTPGVCRKLTARVALDEAHAWRALAYVERNPVRAALADRAEDYPWSTAAAHCGTAAAPADLDMHEWRRSFTAERWREVLRVGVAEEALEERIREATRRGAPLGSEAFVERIGRELGRNLRPRAPGRPPKRVPGVFATA